MISFPCALHLLHLCSSRTLYAHARLTSAHHLVRALRQLVTYSSCLACTRQTQGRNIEGGVALRNDPRPGCMVLPIVPNERSRAEQGKSYLSRERTAAASGLLPSRENMVIAFVQSPSAACFSGCVRCSHKSRQLRDYLCDLMLESEFTSPSPS